MRQLHLLFLATVLVILSAACAGTPAVDEARPAPPDPADAPDETDAPEVLLREPPPVEILDVERPLTLMPFTYCWTVSLPNSNEQEGICADGAWPEPIPSAGAVDGPITVRFPVDGWRFVAFVGNKDGSVQDPVDIEDFGDGTFSIGAVGNPSGPIVQLSGTGPQGDVHVVFAVEWASADG